MSLRLVDKYVREGNFAQALGALARARQDQPGNPYILAYEERIMHLLKEQVSQGGNQVLNSPAQGHSPPPSGRDTALPSVEGQLNAIARPMQRQEAHPPAQHPDRQRKDEERRRALIGKIAGLLENASRYLKEQQFDRALEEIARASVLDPDNNDIHMLKEKIVAARDETRRHDEQERLHAEKRRAEEEQRRAREDRLRREEEQQKLREEEEAARRKAQEEKLSACLAQTRELIGEARFVEAQTELAFALLLEPDNNEARALGREIIRREEEQRFAAAEQKRLEEEARRQEEEDRLQEAERLRAIATAIEDADELLEQDLFGDALTTVTRAYILDPTSEDLSACEERIIRARENRARQVEEERRQREEQERHHREELQREEAAKEEQRLRAARMAEEQERKRTLEESVRHHLSCAGESLSSGDLDTALAEAAQAFLLDPFNEEVKLLEQRVQLARVNAQARRDSLAAAPEPEADAPETPREPAPPQNDVPQEDNGRVSEHIGRARRQAACGDFPSAFDEIGKAFLIDPMNPAVQEAETEIQRLFVEFEEALIVAPDQPAPHAVVPAGEPASPLTSETTGRSHPGSSESERRFELRASTGSDRPKTRRPVFAAAALGVLLIAASMILTSAGGNGPSGVLAARTDNPIVTVARDSMTESTASVSAPTAEGPGVDSPPVQTASPVLTAAIEAPEPVPETPVTETRGIANADLESALRQVSRNDSPETDSIVLDEPVVAAEAAKDSASSPPPAAQTRPPAIVRLEQPRIPGHALRSGFPEEVVVSVEIGTDGKPVRHRVVRSTNPFMTQPVVEAVLQSTYTPGHSGGSPQAAWLTIPFHLKK